MIGRENRFFMRLSALSENESFARSSVAAFALTLDPTLEELSDIKTAVSEAVTNCIVHAYEGAEDKYIDMTVIAADDSLTVIVKDEGCGIDDLDRALTPFFTTKKEEERSGMGFAIMKTFMDEFNVVSAKGQGTQVTMTKFIRGARDAQSRRDAQIDRTCQNG